MRENKGVKLFEIEFDNWRVLKPRGSSLSGLLALGGLQEGCEWSSEKLHEGDFSEENTCNSNKLFKYISTLKRFFKHLKS